MVLGIISNVAIISPLWEDVRRFSAITVLFHIGLSTRDSALSTQGGEAWGIFPFDTVSPYVTQATCKLSAGLLLQSPECWDYRRVPQQPSWDTTSWREVYFTHFISSGIELECTHLPLRRETPATDLCDSEPGSLLPFPTEEPKAGVGNKKPRRNANLDWENTTGAAWGRC